MKLYQGLLTSLEQDLGWSTVLHMGQAQKSTEEAQTTSIPAQLGGELEILS